jgi:CRP/FNR family transcriptional regulator, dissimilatory nitrate respiration regulator
MSATVKLNIEALLSHLPLFNSLQPNELARITAGTKEIKIAKGETLFRKGDPCVGFHLIVYGQIKLAFTSANGNEKVVEILNQGQSFGEALMFMEKPYIVFAQALADAQLLHIAKDVIFEQIDHHPKLARKMIAGLSMRLHQLIQDVESYSLKSGRERIIGYLLSQIGDATAETTSVTITLPTSKGTIASRLNLTQEHFSRILHELGQEGLIIVRGRQVTLPDLSALLVL